MSRLSGVSSEALSPYIRQESRGYQLDLYVKGMKCGHCAYKIEKALQRLGLSYFQFHLGSANLSVISATHELLPKVLRKISELGFEPIPIKNSNEKTVEIKEFKRSLKGLAVAGVCAGNIMLFSVAIYLGAPPEFQAFFHKLSFFPKSSGYFL